MFVTSCYTLAVGAVPKAKSQLYPDPAPAGVPMGYLVGLGAGLTL